MLASGNVILSMFYNEVIASHPRPRFMDGDCKEQGVDGSLEAYQFHLSRRILCRSTPSGRHSAPELGVGFFMNRPLPYGQGKEKRK